MSRFDFGGGAVLAAGFVGLSFIGVSPLALLSGEQDGGRLTSADGETDEFAKAILRETEIIWGDLFAEAGKQHSEPTRALFSGAAQSAWGHASAAAGPFYRQADRKVYLDTDFSRRRPPTKRRPTRDAEKLCSRLLGAACDTFSAASF
ncbi:MAG: neutral zinc metallopeptidase [Amphiplicatus sp.]